ncbi:MAG TPA: hypothetical protein VG106_06740, partial [Vicinamibacterales bacterium]|nr:hypothetical protein [Vicinamibacterales bacterium]
MGQGDQHRHGELPLEAQRYVDRDDEERGDDRVDRVLGHRAPEARADLFGAGLLGQGGITGVTRALRSEFGLTE